MVLFEEDLQGLLSKPQSSELLGCCAGRVDFVQSYGMQYESENPLFGVPLGFFSRKSRRFNDEHGESFHQDILAVEKRQVDLKYVGRLLLDTEQRCT